MLCPPLHPSQTASTAVVTMVVSKKGHSVAALSGCLLSNNSGLGRVNMMRTFGGKREV